MESVSTSQRTQFPKGHLRLMILLVLVGVTLGVAVSFVTKKSNEELSKACAAGAATLFFGGLLGGFVGLLIADFDRRRLKRAAQIEYLSKILADLKAVYDEVDRGRTLVEAHKSAKTYGEEMKNFITARVKLLQIDRALRFDERGSAVAKIREKVGSMEAYLKLLINEFVQDYKDISREQSLYEARMKSALEDMKPPPADASKLPVNTPWNKIAALQQVSDFLNSAEDCQIPGVEGKSKYCLEFLRPLDAATSELRQALRAEFENRSPSHEGP